MDLSCFLSQNAQHLPNEKYVASNRFIDADGKPAVWEIKPIDTATDERLRKESVDRIPVSGKKGRFEKESNYNKYLAGIAVEATVFPNLNNAELQNSYGVMDAVSLLQKMLTPGEYALYIDKVQEVSGYKISFEDLVDEAKN
jgi:hypothetical protein